MLLCFQQLLSQTRAAFFFLGACLESISTGALCLCRLPTFCFKITGELLILNHFLIVMRKATDRQGMVVIYRYAVVGIILVCELVQL